MTAGDDVPGAGPAAGTWYSRRFLAEVPRVLTLLDRHRLSRTYGCFDRNHWHYRTQDFPSGMYAEYALSLAHAFATDLPDSRWRGRAAVKEWALAGVRYAATSAHGDGSCDDYYPNERALGATAFAAAAAAETMRLVGERPKDLVAFAGKRARWLLGRHESGILSNHHALVALAGARAAALGFAAAFLHPDGSFGGEHGSRNTCQVLPSAFERCADRSAAARRLSDGWLAGAERDVVGRPDDDRILCHLLGDLPAAHAARTSRVIVGGIPPVGAPGEPARTDAARSGGSATRTSRVIVGGIPPVGGNAASRSLAPVGVPDEPARTDAARSGGFETVTQGVTSFPGARLLVVRHGDLYLVVATSKGGAFRAFRGDRLLRAESGLVGRDEKGRLFVTDRVDPSSAVEIGERRVTVRGHFQRAKANLATPWKVVLFRFGTLTLGRVAPDLVRRVLQGALITGRKPAPLAFERTIEWGDGVKVTDRLVAERGAPRLVDLLAATDATSTYVATSRIWQDAGTQPWDDLSAAAARLAADGSVSVERAFS